MVGFDIESKPCFKKGEFNYPSLLQLATDREVMIVKLLEISDRTPLVPFLESERVIKAGVGVRDDVRRLATLFEFSPAAFIEIGTLAQKLGYQKTGLAFLTQEVFGLKLSKRARLTNWERKDLTPSQIRYAAADAHLSREIYLKLLERFTENDLQEITFCTFPSILPLQGFGLSRL